MSNGRVRLTSLHSGTDMPSGSIQIMYCIYLLSGRHGYEAATHEAKAEALANVRSRSQSQSLSEIYKPKPKPKPEVLKSKKPKPKPQLINRVIEAITRAVTVHIANNELLLLELLSTLCRDTGRDNRELATVDMPSLLCRQKTRPPLYP